MPDRRRDRREALILLSLIVLTLAVFATTPLDIDAARAFYRPPAADHWPLASERPWSVLYRLAPPLTVALVLGALGWLIAALLSRNDRWRRDATFVLLSVALGPGLIINAGFKDHWHRPRPRDVVQFAGPLHYVPAPLHGQGGASFPCGHCSVGFAYGLGFWIWRSRRRAWARISLATGIAAGAALGLGRMAAGAHFLSDIVWSALLTFTVAHLLYYHVLRIPQHLAQDAAAPGPRGAPRAALRWGTLLAAGGAAAVLGALLVAPHGGPLSQEFDLRTLAHPARVFQVTARAADIQLVVIDAPAPAHMSTSSVVVTGELHGFGLPTSVLASGFRFEPATETLAYAIEQRGWFTDLSGAVTIDLPLERFGRIVVALDRGDIKVIDLTHSGAVRRGFVQLALATKTGLVQQPR